MAATQSSVVGTSAVGSATPVAALEAPVSAVSWAAILAGAFVTAAVALMLVAVGAGFGFSAISPWTSTGSTVAAIGVGAGIWLIVVQWLSAGVGGYVTGRLRTSWTGIHTDEVFFRDTAHGLLTWAVAVVVSVALLSSAASTIVGGAAKVGGAAVSTVAQGAASAGGAAAGSSNISQYFTDSLFRTDHPATNGSPEAANAEAGRIIASSLASGDLAAPDKTYLAQLVAARTGLSQADAEKRVTDVVAKAKEAAAQAATKAKEVADAARKSAAYLAFFLFISWLVGAFIACVAAAYGGNQRDEFHATFKRV